MANFPSSLPAAGSASTTATLAAAGHTSLHNVAADEARALATKIGTGASTPVANQVLRGDGAGTSSWSGVVLTSDVSGILPTTNGGTGTTSTTGSGSVVYSAAPALTGGGSWAGSPTITSPTIADLSNMVHTHASNSQGGQLPFTALISTIFSGQVSSQANAGTAGGTIYYVNLGGIKLAFGITSSQTNAAGTSASYTVTLPTSFFSTIQFHIAGIAVATGSANNNTLVGISCTTTTFTISWANDTGSPGVGGTAAFLVIGT